MATRCRCISRLFERRNKVMGNEKGDSYQSRPYSDTLLILVVHILDVSGVVCGESDFVHLCVCFPAMVCYPAMDFCPTTKIDT